MTEPAWIDRLQHAWDDGLFILKPPELDPDDEWFDNLIAGFYPPPC